MKELAEAVLGVKSIADIECVLRLASKNLGNVGWRAVGDRPNNIGIVRIASEPSLAMVERVTNAMDAMLDLAHLERPLTSLAVNPREAAKAWFKIPQGGLAGLTEGERRELGKAILVRLDESGEPKRPTVVVRDHGIGQSPRHFPKTLVSLNETNKVRQPWTIGTYGQGGAATFGFSKATVIISRRHPAHRGGEPDLIGWTIVQEHAAAEREVLPSYKFLVGEGDEVPGFAPDLVPDLPHGTIIIHVGYDLQGYTGPWTTGIWQFFHSALFDPVLPFLVSGTREKEKSYGDRVVTGNSTRLANLPQAGGDTADRRNTDLIKLHEDSLKFDLGPEHGHVLLNYWAVGRPEGSEKHSDPAGSYVKPDSAVVMTLFGQRQDAESRMWLKDRAKLPFLFKNLVVQVDADGLTGLAKKEIFASTRERATNSELKRRIYDELAEVLRQDDVLRALNHAEKERLLRKSTEATNEKIQKRLAKFIRTKLKETTKKGEGGASEGDHGRKKQPPGGGPTRRNIDDTNLPHVPSILKFTKPRVRLYRGSRSFVWIELNAKNGYLPRHDSDLTLTMTPDDGKLRQTSRSKLQGGRARWGFEVADDAALGARKFTAQLMTANGILSDSIEMSVEVAPEAKPEGKGTEEDTGPKIEWVSKAEWGDHGFDARTVGKVDEGDDETVIWVSKDMTLLAKAVSGATLTEAQIEGRRDRYLYPVACALWMQEQARRKATNIPDAYLKEEMYRLAEAVLVAMDPDIDLTVADGEDQSDAEGDE